MELLENLKDIFNTASSFEQTKNYYFENHICHKTGDNIKINLNYKISSDDNDKIMKFGICNDCKKVFYHYDFENNSL